MVSLTKEKLFWGDAGDLCGYQVYGDGDMSCCVLCIDSYQNFLFSFFKRVFLTHFGFFFLFRTFSSTVAQFGMWLIVFLSFRFFGDFIFF